MFCPNCGHDRDENNKFCTNCGFRFEEPVPEAPKTGTGFAARVTQALKSDLFLVMCILYSVAAVLSIAEGGINVFTTLFTIFFWLLFAAARSKNIADVNSLRCVSGTVFAMRVVLWVAFGMMLLGTAMIFIASAVMSGTEILSEVNGTLGETFEGVLPEAMTSDVTVFLIVFAVFAVIIAVIALLINLLIFKKIHRFTKSLYPSVANDRDAVVGANGARIAIFVMGIITAVLTVFGSLGGGFVYIVSNSCLAAGRIVLSVIINRNICKTENQL